MREVHALGACRGCSFWGQNSSSPLPVLNPRVGWEHSLLPTLTRGQGFARKEDLVSDGVVSEGMGTGRGTALALGTHCQGPQPGVLSSATLLLRPWARCLAAQPQVWGLLWGGPGLAPRLLHGLLLCCVPTALGHCSAPDERTLITSLPSQPGYAPCWTLPTPQPPVSGEGA